MLRKTLIGLAILLLIVLALVARFFFSNTPFNDKAKSLYIHTGHTSKDEIMASLEENHLIRNPVSFRFLASQMDVWPKVRAGKYEITRGMGLFDIARMLRNAHQAPVNLIITKLRTKDNLAALIGKNLRPILPRPWPTSII